LTGAGGLPARPFRAAASPIFARRHPIAGPGVTRSAGPARHGARAPPTCKGRCGGRLLGERHNTAPAERYSVKAMSCGPGDTDHIGHSTLTDPGHRIFRAARLCGPDMAVC